MAMIKTDGTETEGKVGGVVYRSDQCGMHIQGKGRYVSNEPSKEQIIRRNAFRKCTGYIRKCATQYVTAAWQDYANHHPKKTCKGKIYTLTWWQQFIAYNINRVIADEPIIGLPPGYGSE